MNVNEKDRQYAVICMLNEDHGIYLVRDTRTGRQYVKKILTVYSADVFRDLISHPVNNIPRIHDMWESEGLLYIIEEYIYGNNLKDILETRHCLNLNEAADITLKLCRILESLHSLQPPVVHRDIKPSNIIISPDGEVWLIDMNAAKPANSQASRDTVLIGTEGYAAPEQYGFGPSSCRTDIYAVGILLNEMLTGSLPSEKKVEGPLQTVIEKCTKMEASDRYSSAGEIIQALNSIMSDSRTGSSKTRRPVKYHKWAPPGFRSGHIWKMILASLGYISIFALGLTLEVENADTARLWANRIAFILVSLIAIFYLSDYGKIWSMTGITKVRWIWLRIVLIIVSAALLIFILMIIFAIINSSLQGGSI